MSQSKLKVFAVKGDIINRGNFLIVVTTKTKGDAYKIALEQSKLFAGGGCYTEDDILNIETTCLAFTEHFGNIEQILCEQYYVAY